MANRAPCALFLLLGGCSLSTFSYVPCESDAMCRSTFGWGYTCNAETSLCDEVPVSNRCETSYPEDLLTDRLKYKDAILYGALLWRGLNPDTPEDYFSVEPEMQAFELAVSQVDNTSGLAGAEVGLIECTNEEGAYYDDLGGDDPSVAVAHYLSYDVGVAAILGPDYSNGAIAVYTDVAPNGTLVMSHSSTASALTDIDGTTHSASDPGLFWRTCAPDSLQAEVIASDMQQRGVTKVAVIYGTGLYGEGLADAFNTDFSALGGTVTLKPFDENESDEAQLTDAIVSVGNSDVDEVLFIASQGSLVEAFLQGASIDAYDTKNIFLTDAAYSSSTFEDVQSVAGDLYPRVRGTYPLVDVTSSAYQLFQSTYQQAYNLDPTGNGYTAQAYDAAWLVMYGTAWSLFQTDGITGIGIAKGLRNVSYASGDAYRVVTKKEDWSTVQAAFEEGTSIDVTGASGNLDYDKDTGETTTPIEVWTISCDGSTCEFAQDYVIDPS